MLCRLKTATASQLYPKGLKTLGWCYASRVWNTDQRACSPMPNAKNQHSREMSCALIVNNPTVQSCFLLPQRSNQRKNQQLLNCFPQGIHFPLNQRLGNYFSFWNKWMRPYFIFCPCQPILWCKRPPWKCDKLENEIEYFTMHTDSRFYLAQTR